MDGFKERIIEALHDDDELLLLRHGRTGRKCQRCHAQGQQRFIHVRFIHCVFASLVSDERSFARFRKLSWLRAVRSLASRWMNLAPRDAIVRAKPREDEEEK